MERYKVINPTKEIQHMVDKIKEYFVNNGNKDTKAVIGISGGKDSTVAAALLVRALGKDKVIGVLMPEGHQSDIADSYEVCKILGIKFKEIDIGPITAMFANQFGHTYNKPAIATNTPARIRMAVLYAVAADVGGRVINTGNYSEKYVGYTTKYGDLAGDFAILRDYAVREILEIGDNLDELPSRLVHKTPGDGMSGKTDEDNMGFTYDVLDAYLLDNVTPDYETLRNIEDRHKRNIHKETVHMPYIRNLTRYWNDWDEPEEESPFSF